MKKLYRAFCDLDYFLLACSMGFMFFGSAIFATTLYTCEEWKGSDDAPDWLRKDSEPFLMLKDGEDLHIRNAYNEPITITKFAWHNELIDLYQRVDPYGTTSVYYFKHSNYEPESFERIEDPKMVQLKKAAYEPQWMIKTDCYKSQ